MTTIVAYSPTGIIDKALFNFDAMGGGLVDFKLSGTVNVSISQPFMYSQYQSGYGNNQVWSPDVASVVWNAAQVANINSMLAMYSSFINLSFSSVVNDTAYSPAGVGLLTNSDINISLIYRTDLNFSGESSIYQNYFGYTGSALDVILNEAGFGSTNYTLNNDTYGFHTLMHEIGHSLGLSHPHSAYTNGVATLTSDYAATVNIGFQKLGFVINSAADMNKEYFSIMSYDDTKPPSGADTFAQTPMILDAIALIDAYGAGTGTSGSGNDTITPGASGVVSAYRTYFDLGGTNTVNLVNYSTGAYFNMGTTITGASHLVGVSMAMDDYKTMIAAGTPSGLRWYYGEFQNALGSIGNDYIVGNDLNNIIDAISGYDRIDGGGGTNTLVLECSINDCIKAGVLNNSSVDVIYTKLGIDTISNIQTITFTDGSYSISSLLSRYSPIVSISNNGGYTNNIAPVITGSALPNSTITLFDGSNYLGTATVNSAGNWSKGINLSGQGDHVLKATLVDAAGNSNTSQSVTLTVDTVAPTVVIDYSSSYTLFNQRALTVSGTGEVGTTVTVYDGNTQIATATVNSARSWSVQTSMTSQQGVHNITATDVDAAGNIGTSNTATYTLDTIAPVVAITSNGRVTNRGDQTISGTSEAGAQISVYANGYLQSYGIVTDSNGNWTTSVRMAGAGSGNYVFNVTASDAAGNVSALSNGVTFIMDNIAPTVAITSSGGIITQATQAIFGTGEAGTVVSVYDGGGSTLLGTSSVANNGAWTFSTNFSGIGTHTILVTDVDAAGNTGVSNLINFNFQPPIPVISSMSNRSTYIPSGWQKIDPAFFGDGGLQVSSTNTITQYKITDSGGHLQFYANGAVVTGDNFTFSNPYLNGQLSTDVYVRGLSAGTDTLTISANDGATWSNAVTFTDVVKAADTPFTVSSNGIKATTQANGSGGTLLSSLVNFSSSSSGNGVMQLQFYDVGGGNDGHFTFFDGANTNSVSAGQVIWLNVASQIPTVKYVASTTPGSTETLYVNAYDGFAWSGWYSWNQVSGSSTNNAPVITHMDDRTASIQSGWTQVNTSFLSDGSFTVTDANGDAINKYRIIDTTTTGTHVQFYKTGANGGFVAAGQTMEFTASDVTNGKLYYQGVSIGTDTLTIQAYDGQDWSSAYTYHITVRSADTPLTIAASNSNSSGSTPLSSLVNITNSNHDNVVQLQLYNDAINNDGGYFTYLDGNGVSQKVQPGIIANLTTLAQVASVQYVAGNMMVASSEMIHLNAFNGYSWSGWTGLTEQANTSSQMMLGLSNDGLYGILENSTFGTPTQVSNGLPVMTNYLESSGQQIHLDIRCLIGLSADTNGNLLASQFVSGAGAQSSLGGNVHLAYDTATGGLYYQATGHTPVEIAIIGQAGHFNQLSAADFHLG